MRISARFFLAVATFLVGATVVYVLVSSDDVGAIALLASGVMAAFIGVYLERSLRADDHREVAPYLPHASVWPWWIGVGALFLGLGLVFGLWALIPGVLLLARGVWGSARESRYRT